MHGVVLPRLQSYEAAARSSARPAKVWALLLDARSWPRWSSVDELVAERSHAISEHGRDEVGAIRAFRTGDAVAVERITLLRRERVFRYVGVEHPVMSDYEAAVTLLRDAGGTQIRWYGTYRTEPALADTLREELADTMQRAADGLAAHAAR